MAIPELHGQEGVAYPDAGVEISVSTEPAPAESLEGDPAAAGWPGEIIELTVTWEGGTRVLTTAPKHPGSHYPDRGGATAADTPAGRVTVAQVDGVTYIVLHRTTSGLYTQIAWRLDAPCGTEAGAAGAEPIPGAPSYTG